MGQLGNLNMRENQAYMFAKIWTMWTIYSRYPQRFEVIQEGKKKNLYFRMQTKSNQTFSARIFRVDLPPESDGNS